MRIQDVMMHLLLKQPFYGYVASSLTPAESRDVPTVSLTLLPVPRLVYNKEWYENLNSDHAVGVLLHELLHLILMHPFRKGNRESQLWMIACDMAANEHIYPGLLIESAVTVEKMSEEIGEVIPRLKSAEFYYDIISKPGNRPGFVEEEKEIKVILKNGQELKVNNTPRADASDVHMNAAKSLLAEVVEQAKEEGEIPGGLNGVIQELYKDREINWRNVLKRFLTGKGKTQVRKTCKRESKRFENLPGNKRTTGVNALLALDESGSISEKQMSAFYGEILGIRKISGANILVTQFDTQCTEPVPLAGYIRGKKRVKCGGTDFRPVFKLADSLRIPLLIIFTDGEGTAPQNSNQNVLWILTENGKKPAEYGHYINFTG